MSRLRQLKRQTRVLLDDLGDGPGGVAASLAAAGVHGVPRDNRSCALALYLSSQMGGESEVRSIAVGHCSLMLTLVHPRNGRPAGRLLVQLPKPIRQFVAAFDAMAYPTIVRPSGARPSRPPGHPGGPGEQCDQSGEPLADCRH